MKDKDDRTPQEIAEDAVIAAGGKKITHGKDKGKISAKDAVKAAKKATKDEK